MGIQCLELGNNVSLMWVSLLPTYLTNHFSLKDLGLLTYFLSIEAQTIAQGLFLSQQKYICDLKNLNRLEAKKVSSPMSYTKSFHLYDDNLIDDATWFHQVLGSMQ